MRILVVNPFGDTESHGVDNLGRIARPGTEFDVVNIADVYPLRNNQWLGMGAGQQSRIHRTRLACDKADKWFLQHHPKTLGLKFRDGLSRPDKANTVGQYLLWEQLSPPEREGLLDRLDGPPEPITKDERAEWISNWSGACLSSDAYIPFRDNVDKASRSNVQYVAQPGGSQRDGEVTQAAEQYGMTMLHTGLRCFLH